MRSAAAVLPLALLASPAYAFNLRRGQGYSTSTCTTSTTGAILSDTFDTPTAAPVQASSTCTTSTTPPPPPPQPAEMTEAYGTPPAPAVATPPADSVPSADPVINQPAVYGETPAVPAPVTTADADMAEPVTTSFIDLYTTIIIDQTTTSCSTSTILTVMAAQSVGYSTVQTVVPYTAQYNVTSQIVASQEFTIMQTSTSVSLLTNASTAVQGAAQEPTTGLPVVASPSLPDQFQTPAYTGTDVVLPSTPAADVAGATTPTPDPFASMAATPTLSDSFATPTDNNFGAGVSGASSSTTSPAQQMGNDASHPTFGTGAIVAALAAFVGLGFF